VPANDDGPLPAGNQLGNNVGHDGLAENGAAKVVPTHTQQKKKNECQKERKKKREKKRKEKKEKGTGCAISKSFFRYLIVPLGLFHICFRLNSLTLASSGVMVAHLMPTLCSAIALAASRVTWNGREERKKKKKIISILEKDSPHTAHARFNGK
jgi:hypothetical protein